MLTSAAVTVVGNWLYIDGGEFYLPGASSWNDANHCQLHLSHLATSINHSEQSTSLSPSTHLLPGPLPQSQSTVSASRKEPFETEHYGGTQVHPASSLLAASHTTH
jgi:hypothetical protein